MTANPDLYDTLREFVGLDAGPPRQAPDPVNQPMIRHFVEAMGDDNPIYVDDQAARAAGRDGVVAPAPMLSTWLMLGYRERQTAGQAGGAADTPLARLLGLLTAGGFTGVVATNDEQTYHRELRPGDQLSMSMVIEDVSPRKQTALGPGHFVTTLRTYRDAGGAVVAEQRFRILRFAPQQAPDDADAGVSARPRPFGLPDNEFWFAAAREHRLVIQACDGCSRLRHPPSPVCPHCLCPTWHEVAASGRGTVHSYVITHHPRAPGFEYPLAVILADLEEGTRLVADFTGDPGSVQIGMPVEVEWVRLGEEFTLPRFRAAGEV
jgi:3-oxo-4,17-pregnadiene-20-carboxyl-CoA hydratase alpha subunit